MMHGLFGSRTFLVLILLVTLVGACSKEQPPVPRPAPPPAPPDISEPAPPPAPEPPPPIVPLEPLEERSIGARTLDELNRDSPLKPVFFAYDSSQVRAGGAGDAPGERRAAADVPAVGPHDRGAL